ncbi:MAG: hypothetical protein H7331_04640 [Bacteroidia bacterium]|nr:hypothetical protein [Bacteroidia bacterium]
MTTASFTIQTNDSSQIETLKEILKALKIKFEFNTADKPYNPEFVAKIQESDKQYKEGNYKTIATKDLWK